MSYPMLGSNFQARKPQYGFQMQYNYDHRYNNRVLIEHDTLNIKQGLDIFTGIIYKNVLVNVHHGFNALKALMEDTIDMSRSFEKQLSILLEKTFEILEIQQLRVKQEAFECFKYNLKVNRYTPPNRDLSYRLALKNLAAYAKAKKFRKALIQISKTGKQNYQALKIRFFMNVCQNYLAKNDMPRDLYLGFREWHLQTVIRNLATLSEDQNSLAFENRKFAIMNFHSIFMKHMHKTFFILKNSNSKGIMMQRFLFSRLRLISFMEKISRPFVQRSLALFPKASLNTKRRESHEIYGLAFGFYQIQKALKWNKTEKNGKNKGILRLVQVLSKRLVQRYSLSFLRLNSIKPQFEEEEDEIEEFSENQNKASEIIFSALLSNLKKKYFYALNKIMHHKAIDPRKLWKEKIRTGLNKLHLIHQRPSQNMIKRVYFYRWKADSFRVPRQNILLIEKLQVMQLKDSIQSVLLRALREPFNKIMAKPLASKQQKKNVVKSYPEDENIIYGTMLNQAVVNRQLELRHQRKHEKVNKTRQQQALLKIILSSYGRSRHNSIVVSKYLQKWQENISFRNNKVNDYSRCLDVLMNENGLITKEIDQFHMDPESPANMSSKRLDFGRQIRYLEFLEIQNSNLMEVLKTYEPDIEQEEGDLEEIKEEIHRKISRSYSI